MGIIISAAVIKLILKIANAGRGPIESVVGLLAAPGCNATSGRLVGGAPGITPVLVAVAGRTNAALPGS